MHGLIAGAGGICLAFIFGVSAAWSQEPSDGGVLPVPALRPDAPTSAAELPNMPLLPKEAPEIAGGRQPAQALRDTACENALKQVGAVFTVGETIEGEGSCGLTYPVVIETLPGGVTVQPSTEMTCSAALSLALWTRDVAAPAALTLGDGVKLQGLTNASTYVCRNRNNQSDAKISEHAKGNAIDISAFSFTGRDPITVTARDRKGTPEEAFQKAVRFGACLHFKTVLGPGSDIYHGDHLHFDMAERRGGYRLCRYPAVE